MSLIRLFELLQGADEDDDKEWVDEDENEIKL